jgi:diguanylate cyclase (GGDEF)-like protein
MPPFDAPPSLRGSHALAKHWLLDRYFRYAWLLLAWGTVMAAFRGTYSDVLGLIGYVAITAGSWLVARKKRWFGAFAHLTLLFPYWTWYDGLEGGLPALLGGAPGFAAMLVFPTMTLVALDGRRGAVLSIGLAALGLAIRFDGWTERDIGAFLIGSGAIIGLVYRGLTRDLEQAHAELSRQARVDPVTGAASRRGLEEEARKLGPSGAFLFVDLSRFRTINDVFGHVVGDELLRRVVARVRKATKEGALIARLDADELAVLVRGADEAEALRLGNEIAAHIEQPFEVGGQLLHTGAHVGVAHWPKDGDSLADLLRASDHAMIEAKKRGTRVAVAKSDIRGVPRRALEVDLWRAIERRELVVHLQPVMDLASSRLAGAEALVRWQHPDRGLLHPPAFIELAEETGQIVAIDHFVLTATVAHLRTLRERGVDVWVAVNVSARTLDDESLLPRLRELLGDDRGLAQGLVLEITETAAMRDPEAVVERLEHVRALGVGAAIDDFGMGYSSLAYLRRLPATHLKLDRAFTSGIGHHERDEQVIDFVLQLAERLGMHVVAEGVEHEAQRRWLANRGCRYGQGFGLGRPEPAEAFLTRAQAAPPSGPAAPASGPVDLDVHDAHLDPGPADVPLVATSS